MFRISNNEVNKLCQDIGAYLQSIGQIHFIFQTPRAHISHRRTQPYGENKILGSSIDDLIIYTI